MLVDEQEKLISAIKSGSSKAVPDSLFILSSGATVEDQVIDALKGKYHAVIDSLAAKVLPEKVKYATSMHKIHTIACWNADPIFGVAKRSQLGWFEFDIHLDVNTLSSRIGGLGSNPGPVKSDAVLLILLQLEIVQ